jgi:hypothetical protein
MSKKKFMEEVQAMPPPPPLSSTDDFPTIGLNELGRRLITEENEFIVPKEVKEEKLPLPPPPPPPSSTKQAKKDETTTKQVKQDEIASTVQSNKKVRIVELILSMNYNKVNHKIILFGIILYIITK